MKRLLARVCTLLVLGLLGLRAVAAPWVSGFYVGWASGTLPPSAVDYASMTHVMMFSALPRTDGTLDTSFFGAGPTVASELAQRAHAAGRKAVLVVGGAGTGPQFVGATSAVTIDRFVQNVAAAVAQHGYDGVDIDWEPINAADHPAVLSLVAKLRAALPAGALITVDVGWLNANFPLGSADAQFYAQLGAAVDQMNIMTYGMADNWGGWLSWHSSALFGAAGNTPSSVESSINGYVNAGVPVAKLGMGIGFYGSCWGSPVTAPRQSPGSAYVLASDNEMSYANIMAQYHSAAAYRYDSTAQAPYLSFASPTGPRGCTFVSYEDATSIAAKGQYARDRGLGGTIVWQINEGYQPGTATPNALLAAVGAAFLAAPTTPTTTALVATPGPTVYGQTVTYTATVSSSGGTPGGTVVFSDGSTPLGSATLASGQASLSTPTLAAGSHAVSARYAGQGIFMGSLSASVFNIVSPASTATALSSSRNPSRLKQRPTFTARVSAVAPGGGVPAGTVSFFDGATMLGQATLSNGSATFTPASLARGTHTITATFAGSPNHKTSTSSALSQVVN